MLRVHGCRLSDGLKRVARVKRVQPNDFISRVSRAIHDEPEKLASHMEDAISAARSNQLSIKEISLLFHELGKATSLAHVQAPVSQFIADMKIKVLKSPKFVSFSTPLDISLLLNGLVKIVAMGVVDCRSNTVKIIAGKICEEIPLKISLFEDHQLAQVVHALARLEYLDETITMEIINEIEMARDLASFNLQTIIMLASSVSRLIVLKNKNKSLEAFWLSVMRKMSSVSLTDMQPNWPDVLLSSVAHSGIDFELIPKKFITNMVAAVEHQGRVGLIPKGRVLKAIDSLVRMNASSATVATLRELCDR